MNLTDNNYRTLQYLYLILQEDCPEREQARELVIGYILRKATGMAGEKKNEL